MDNVWDALLVFCRVTVSVVSLVVLVMLLAPSWLHPWLPCEPVGSIMELEGRSNTGSVKDVVHILQVPRREWGSHEGFASSLVSSGTPAIITDSVVKRWEVSMNPISACSHLIFTFHKAINWSIPKLEEELCQRGYDRLEVEVKTSKDSTFKFASLDKAFLTEGVVDHGVQVRRMPFSELFASFKSPSEDYYYFSDGISVLRELSQKVLPLDDLSPSRNIKDCDVNIWIGQSGVSTHAHFDRYENFFAQVSGRKEVRLVAPSASTQMHTYPSLHPHARQAQIDLLAPLHEARPLSEPLQIWEAILEEGDLLYIPAYWWHRITSLDPSISVNAWCPSRSSVYSAEVEEKFSFPFEQSWGKSQRAWFVKQYFIRLLNLVYQEPNSRQVEPDGTDIRRHWSSTQAVQSLLRERYFIQEKYSHLLCEVRETQSWNELGSASSVCETTSKDSSCSLLSELGINGATSSVNLCGAWDAPEPERTEVIESWQPKIEGLAVSLRDPMLLPSVRDSLLGDWLEAFSAWAVGAGHVHAYLHCCFLNEMKAG